MKAIQRTICIVSALSAPGLLAQDARTLQPQQLESADSVIVDDSRIGSALARVVGGVPAARVQVPSAAAPDLATLLSKATAYIQDYVTALSSVVSEERYEQRVDTRGDSAASRTTVTRTILADYLLVQVPGSSEWLPFRDVFSVDGESVRDRSDRLLKLFVESSSGAMQRAMQIRNESSRYNIGGGMRDTNVPMFALQFLTAENRRSFSFKLRGHQRLEGMDVVEVEYQETASPTFIVGRSGEDVPARGRFWIAAADGRVIKTSLETKPFGGSTRIDVVFRDEPALGLWVPSQMDESRTDAAEKITGRATYGNFRRFQVNTSIEIK